jgi:hypothetical protein
LIMARGGIWLAAFSREKWLLLRCYIEGSRPFTERCHSCYKQEEIKRIEFGLWLVIIHDLVWW